MKSEKGSSGETMSRNLAFFVVNNLLPFFVEVVPLTVRTIGHTNASAF